MTERKSRHDTMRAIEAKHFGRCMDQVWGDGRRTLIERMELRGTPGLCAMVVKQFESRVSLSSSKPFPELSGCWVFVPIEDGDNSWTGLDEKLTAFREVHKYVEPNPPSVGIGDLHKSNHPTALANAASWEQVAQPKS